MMNNDNSITAETKLYGFIAEEAHSNRFSSMVNTLFKADGINAMVIPMNIRPDDLVFTVSQMRHSKLSGAIIGSEYQGEVLVLMEVLSKGADEAGLVDFIRIENNVLFGDLITPMALDAYAENEEFKDNIALRSLCRYFYDLIRGERG